MHLGRGGKDHSAWMSGGLRRPSGKAILLKLAPERLVRPTHPDAPDAHFVVADVWNLEWRLNVYATLWISPFSIISDSTLIV